MSKIRQIPIVSQCVLVDVCQRRTSVEVVCANYCGHVIARRMAKNKSSLPNAVPNTPRGPRMFQVCACRLVSSPCTCWGGVRQVVTLSLSFYGSFFAPLSFRHCLNGSCRGPPLPWRHRLDVRRNEQSFSLRHLKKGIFVSSIPATLAIVRLQRSSP